MGEALEIKKCNEANYSILDRTNTNNRVTPQVNEP